MFNELDQEISLFLMTRVIRNGLFRIVKLVEKGRQGAFLFSLSLSFCGKMKESILQNGNKITCHVCEKI